ncbi:MAG: radical SAM protein [Chitinispirillaceae bacterium]|nr:radical SAM protein [Chitinispirillaceae bacterium]
MHYEGDIYRPPSEANSILLQVTAGCSHNGCHFCGAYKNKKFRIKDEAVIQEDLHYAAKHFADNDRLFLCDGDALIISQERLVGILDAVKKLLPRVRRIGSYANAKSLARKSPEDLLALRERGLTMIHMGLESGDDETLRSINKWGTAGEIVEQGIKVGEAKIKLFVTVILGLAGPRRSAVHAEKTGAALTRMNPPYVGALSLMPVEGTPLYERLAAGEFQLMNPRQMLEELKIMLEHTELRPGTFYANHASNYLPLRVRLPQDKTSALALIDSALRGEIPLTPEWLRGL